MLGSLPLNETPCTAMHRVAVCYDTLAALAGAPPRAGPIRIAPLNVAPVGTSERSDRQLDTRSGGVASPLRPTGLRPTQRATAAGPSCALATGSGIPALARARLLAPHPKAQSRRRCGSERASLARCPQRCPSLRVGPQGRLAWRGAVATEWTLTSPLASPVAIANEFGRCTAEYHSSNPRVPWRTPECTESTPWSE